MPGTPSGVNRYQPNDVARLVATITASGGVVTQPSSLALHIRNPLGSVASYIFGVAAASIANPGAGMFYKDFSIPPPASQPVGTWGYGFHASGLVSGYEDWLFIVDPSKAL